MSKFWLVNTTWGNGTCYRYEVLLHYVRRRYLAKSSGGKMVYLQLKVSPFLPIEDTRETRLSACVVTDYSAIGVRDISQV